MAFMQQIPTLKPDSEMRVNDMDFLYQDKIMCCK